MSSYKRIADEVLSLSQWRSMHFPLLEISTLPGSSVICYKNREPVSGGEHIISILCFTCPSEYGVDRSDSMISKLVSVYAHALTFNDQRVWPRLYSVSTLASWPGPFHDPSEMRIANGYHNSVCALISLITVSVSSTSCDCSTLIARIS